MKEYYYIRIKHADSTYSWLNAGSKIRLSRAKAESTINALRRLPEFEGAKFDTVPA